MHLEDHRRIDLGHIGEFASDAYPPGRHCPIVPAGCFSVVTARPGASPQAQEEEADLAAGAQWGTGIRPATVVPDPGQASSSMEPPSAARRSLICRRPEVAGMEPGSKPGPSSSTANATPCRSRTGGCEPSSRSRAWPHSAGPQGSRNRPRSSISSGNRPIPWASSSTGMGALAAWAPRAAVSPWSASSGG